MQKQTATAATSNKKHFVSPFLVLLGLCFWTASAHAVYTESESGEVLKEGTWDLGAEPQLVMSGATGVNLSVFGDLPIMKDSSIRARIGSGQSSFDGAVSYKWIPVPDFGKQPAVGGKIELETTSLNGVTTNALRLHPLVSKKFETDQGTFIPYGALPISLMSNSNNNAAGLQLVAGSQYERPDLKQWGFGAELGINLTNVNTYISGYVTFLFDQPDLNIKSRR